MIVTKGASTRWETSKLKKYTVDKNNFSSTSIKIIKVKISSKVPLGLLLMNKEQFLIISHTWIFGIQKNSGEANQKQTTYDKKYAFYRGNWNR